MVAGTESAPTRINIAMDAAMHTPLPSWVISSAPIGSAEPGVMHCSKEGSSSIPLSVRQWNRWAEAKRLGGLEIEKELDPYALLDGSLEPLAGC